MLLQRRGPILLQIDSECRRQPWLPGRLPPDAILDELLATIRRLEAKVDERARAPEAAALEARRGAAARRRPGHNARAAHPRRPRAPVAGKIPDTEIDRLLAEGMPEPKQRAQHGPPAPRTPAEEAAAVRSMKA
jgi:hypothetical protein